MTNRDTETRICNLVDIPLLRRIADRAVILDSETALTRDAQGASGAMLSSILLPQRNLVTMVARSGHHHVIGQFKLHGEDHHQPQAHILYLAPDVSVIDDDTVWLRIFDAMTREAGRQGAHLIQGEVDELSPIFETMRHAGFAVYARQQIWRRMPGTYPCLEPPVQVIPAVDAADIEVTSLITHTVPKMLHQITLPVDLESGWVYRHEGRIQAFISVTSGRHGVYLTPIINPDVMAQTPAIFHAVLGQIARTDKHPAYVRVRRHNEWIGTALRGLQFEPGSQHAVMVRHISARLREPKVKAVKSRLKIIPTAVTVQDSVTDRF